MSRFSSWLSQIRISGSFMRRDLEMKVKDWCSSVELVTYFFTWAMLSSIHMDCTPLFQYFSCSFPLLTCFSTILETIYMVCNHPSGFLVVFSDPQQYVWDLYASDIKEETECVGFWVFSLVCFLMLTASLICVGKRKVLGQCFVHRRKNFAMQG